MKRIVILTLLLSSLGSTVLFSQYNVNKRYYHQSEYTYHYDDRYNPGLCGVASFVFPGLGQIVAGESERGLILMGANVGAYVLSYTGITMMEESSSIYNSSYKTGAYVFLGGLASMLFIEIYATMDAVRVAKVNNLAIRDERKNSVRLQPVLIPTSDGRPASGLGLVYSF